FHGIFHSRDRGENGIDRDQSDRLIGSFVFFTGSETASYPYFQLGIELMLFVESADDLIGVQNLVTLGELNIAGCDFAFLVHAERKLARQTSRKFPLPPSPPSRGSLAFQTDRNELACYPFGVLEKRDNTSSTPLLFRWVSPGE